MNKCYGINMTYNKWYTGYINSIEYTFCIYCKNKYPEICMSLVENRYNFPCKCDSYIMNSISCNNYTISLYDKTKNNNYIVTDTNTITIDTGSEYYIYINNNIESRYYSVNIYINNGDIKNGNIKNGDIKNGNMHIGDINNEDNVLYNIDSLHNISEKHALFILEDGTILNNEIRLEIKTFEIVPDTSIMTSGIFLGEYNYNNESNMIDLKSSSIKHRIKYSYTGDFKWNAESLFKETKTNVLTFKLVTSDNISKLTAANSKYYAYNLMKNKHLAKLAEYKSKEHQLNIKTMYHIINNLCH